KGTLQTLLTPSRTNTSYISSPSGDPLATRTETQAPKRGIGPNEAGQASIQAGACPFQTVVRYQPVHPQSSDRCSMSPLPKYFAVRTSKKRQVGRAGIRNPVRHPERHIYCAADPDPPLGLSRV